MESNIMRIEIEIDLSKPEEHKAFGLVGIAGFIAILKKADWIKVKILTELPPYAVDVLLPNLDTEEKK